MYRCKIVLKKLVKRIETGVKWNNEWQIYDLLSNGNTRHKGFIEIILVINEIASNIKTSVLILYTISFSLF